MSARPPPELRARVLEAARREPARTRAEGARRRAAVVVAGFAAPLLLSWVLGGPNSHDRPAGYAGAMALAFAALAGAATWAGVGQGRSMLGRPTGWRLAVATVTPLALLGVAALASGLWPETNRGHDTPADLASCLVFTPLFAAGPLVAFAFLRRASDPIAPRLTGAALGAAGGAWGAVGITVHCSHATLSHIAFGHVLPVLAIAIVGFWLGQEIVAVPPQTG